MTKQQDFQKELLEKVKPGVKASDLKKLKRSKSAGDIPASSPNQEKQITQLQEQVKFHSKTASNYLKSLQVSQAKVSELEEKLKSSPTNLEELDNSLFARHKSLKDWFNQYQQTKNLDEELSENIDQASTELINQDQTISQLRGQINQLKLTNQSLTKDLNLVTRLAESRKDPLPENNPHSNLPVYAFLAFWFATLLLNTSWKPQKKYEQ